MDEVDKSFRQNVFVKTRSAEFVRSNEDDSKLHISEIYQWLSEDAGRIHRAFDDKEEVRIYDYVEVNVPMLNRMYQKREKGYLALGYEINNV